MELVDVRQENQLMRQRPTTCPCNVQRIKKYVQPPREKSFAPKLEYNSPTTPIESNTTYHASYQDLDHADLSRYRSQPVRPKPGLQPFYDKCDKFPNETTSMLSYQPVWVVVKASPIYPRQKQLDPSRRMESITTSRQDYAPKYIDRPEAIFPCGNIRISKGHLQDDTTTKLSYVSPGAVEPTVSFKPIRLYTRSSEPLLSDTVQKLSYQPYTLAKPEIYPWQKKREYKSPDSKISGLTTYGQSYIKNAKCNMVKPIIPVPTIAFSTATHFADKTVYKESYLECRPERVAPILPNNSIHIAEGKMAKDTTCKLSFQSVRSAKRALILPRPSNLKQSGRIESETTHRRDFSAKLTGRPEPVFPCNNIQIPNLPLEGTTTTTLSYCNPGPVGPVQSFKPAAEYRRTTDKMEFETVNKLSYQKWQLDPKEERKKAQGRAGQYDPPTGRMAEDTVYHMSYPMPGYYVEENAQVADPCSC